MISSSSGSGSRSGDRRSSIGAVLQPGRQEHLEGTGEVENLDSIEDQDSEVLEYRLQECPCLLHYPECLLQDSHLVDSVTHLRADL